MITLLLRKNEPYKKKGAQISSKIKDMLELELQTFLALIQKYIFIDTS